jgi:hypothetical protein
LVNSVHIPAFVQAEEDSDADEDLLGDLTEEELRLVRDSASSSDPETDPDSAAEATVRGGEAGPSGEGDDKDGFWDEEEEGFLDEDEGFAGKEEVAVEAMSKVRNRNFCDPSINPCLYFRSILIY